MSCLKVLLIKSADLKQTRAGKSTYLYLQDDSGEIEGKLWDAQPHNVEAFTAGKVVPHERTEVYNNTPQSIKLLSACLSLVNPMIS